MKNSKKLLFNKIPYEVRRDDLSCFSSKEVEDFLLDAFSQSSVGINDIAKVYIDNKYNPQNIMVEMYKNIKSLKECVSVDFNKQKDQDDLPIKIWVTYVETNTLPEINIIKKTCLDLDCTQSELAYMLGIKEQSLRNMISKNKFTTQLIKAINLLVENQKLKQELQDCISFKKSLQKFINS